MHLTARDVMQTDVISVSPETPLLQVHRLFIEEEINGAPVVDETGAVVGVISSLDLVRAIDEEYETDAGRTTPIYFRDDLPYSGPDWLRAPEDLQDRMAQMTAADVMVRDVVTVLPSAPIAEVAHRLRDQHIHRLLVVDGDQLAGIITTFDLVSLLERPAQPAGPPRPSRPGLTRPTHPRQTARPPAGRD